MSQLKLLHRFSSPVLWALVGATEWGPWTFANLKELKGVLKQQNDHLAEELVESLLAYGLGRTMEFSDVDAVTEILDHAKSDDYRLRSLIREIATQPLFRTK